MLLKVGKYEIRLWSNKYNFKKFKSLDTFYKRVSIYLKEDGYGYVLGKEPNNKVVDLGEIMFNGFLIPVAKSLKEAGGNFLLDFVLEYFYLTFLRFSSESFLAKLSDDECKYISSFAISFNNGAINGEIYLNSYPSSFYDRRIIDFLLSLKRRYDEGSDFKIDVDGDGGYYGLSIFFSGYYYLVVKKEDLFLVLDVFNKESSFVNAFKVAQLFYHRIEKVV